MLVTLETWAEMNLEDPPKINTLRSWAKSGLFYPAPVKVGRGWRVEESARYCPPMKAAAEDPVVEAIINGT